MKRELEYREETRQEEAAAERTTVPAAGWTALLVLRPVGRPRDQHRFGKVEATDQPRQGSVSLENRDHPPFAAGTKRILIPKGEEPWVFQ